MPVTDDTVRRLLEGATELDSAFTVAALPAISEVAP